MLVVEGDPPALLGLLGPLSDLLETMRESGRFVVHVLSASDRRLAETFAGRYPGKDPFDGLDVAATEHGPLIERVACRAFCRLAEDGELGFSVLVRAEIERMDLGEGVGRPLAYQRGEYRALGPPPGERS